MADEPLLDIQVDTKKMTVLGNKLSKYPPFAIQAGLKASNEYLNTDEFKVSMYPPSKMGSPFEWSSEKQRRAFFATDGFGGGIPHERTYELAQSGVFHVNEGSLWIEYTNSMPGAKFVIHPSFQIIGHKKRGWKPVNSFVVAKSRDIARIFKAAALGAWDKMQAFIYGGGAGL